MTWGKTVAEGRRNGAPGGRASKCQRWPTARRRRRRHTSVVGPQIGGPALQTGGRNDFTRCQLPVPSCGRTCVRARARGVLPVKNEISRRPALLSQQGHGSGSIWAGETTTRAAMNVPEDQRPGETSSLSPLAAVARTIGDGTAAVSNGGPMWEAMMAAKQRNT